MHLVELNVERDDRRVEYYIVFSQSPNMACKVLLDNSEILKNERMDSTMVNYTTWDGFVNRFTNMSNPGCGHVFETNTDTYYDDIVELLGEPSSSVDPGKKWFLHHTQEDLCLSDTKDPTECTPSYYYSDTDSDSDSDDKQRRERRMKVFVDENEIWTDEIYENQLVKLKNHFCRVSEVLQSAAARLSGPRPIS